MIAAGFIALTLFTALLLVAGVVSVSKRAYADEQQRMRVVRNTVLLSVVWLGYVTVISLKGVLNNSSLPPRVPLLLVFPAFAFTIFFFTNKRNKALINATPASWPVYFQTFRIAVELLLLLSAIKGIVPHEASMEGYNFDVLIGITAPIVAWLVFSRKVVGTTLLKLWNFAGLITLAIVVFIFMTHAYAPGIWHKQESIISMGFGLFPYTYLAGFLMPCAVFMHVFSLVRLRNGK